MRIGTGPGMIAVAGFQHETNTFAPMNAPYEEFVKADAWPGLTIGEDLFDAMAGKNLPLAGFLEVAQQSGCGIEPLLWCSAEPSSYVTPDAFDRIAAMICDGLSKAGPLDAVYLDLHGAMVTETCEDGEGELLARVREVVGADTPVVASLDLHANLTHRMVDLADGLTVYRTYPHVDMAATGRRAFELLERCLSGSGRFKAYLKIPFLLPLTAQCTNFEPCRSIYKKLEGLENEAVWTADFAAGFPPADIRECGPAVYACGSDRDAAELAVQSLYRRVVSAEPEFEFALKTPDEAVRMAMDSAYDGPVVLADVQDNPGAGGSSDTVGLLQALVRNRARGAVLAILDDEAAAHTALRRGRGGVVDIELGGKSGQAGQTPFKGSFVVEHATEDKFVCSGAMYRGMVADIGPLALLRVNDSGCDVHVIVGSERMQCLDLAVFDHMGIDAARQKILAIKSTVHFRAEFDRISADTLLVEAPGANPCRLLDLPYENLRSGIRLEPMGPEFSRERYRA